MFSHLDQGENFTSFLVCRNPLDKLLSLYNYLFHKFENTCANEKNLRKSKMIKNWNEFSTAVINNSTLPSWHQFLEMVTMDRKAKNIITVFIPQTSTFFITLYLLSKISTLGW